MGDGDHLAECLARSTLGQHVFQTHGVRQPSSRPLSIKPATKGRETSSSSAASPVAAALILAPTATPLFFPSLQATLLETLVTLTVSQGDEAVLECINQHRREQGIYWRRRG